jgi:hypothetical protein
VAQLRLGDWKYSVGVGIQRLSIHFSADLSSDVDFAGLEVEEVDL